MVWQRYNQAGAEAPPRPRLVNTLEKFFGARAGRALDLGCGGGRDTVALLNQGWTVDAVDNDESALAIMAGLSGRWPDQLRVLPYGFDELEPKTGFYDLISASYSLPFCRPDRFNLFFQSIKGALAPGGILSCDLFGKNDSWNQKRADRPQLTFLERREVEMLTEGLKTELLKEDEYDGPSFSESNKHWHMFTLVARKE